MNARKAEAEAIKKNNDFQVRLIEGGTEGFAKLKKVMEDAGTVRRQIMREMVETAHLEKAELLSQAAQIRDLKGDTKKFKQRFDGQA